MAGRQQALSLDVPYVNPLLVRLGPTFFRELPRSPGVYLMRDGAGRLLYVGKAKDLRARLSSYKCARPENVSRKVLRMLRLAHSVEVRLCPSEAAALLEENALLRKERPPFNVLNTRPESYYFIALLPGGAGLDGAPVAPGDPASDDGEPALAPGPAVTFYLTTAPAQECPQARVYGVFKGRRRAQESFVALLRLLSALEARDDRFQFPGPLIRYKPPRSHTAAVPAELLPPLRSFLRGTSRAFLARLMELLLENRGIPRFVHHVITEDLKQLEEFYLYGPLRVQRLKRLHGIRYRAIAQEEIDDLLALTFAARSRAVPRTV